MKTLSPSIIRLEKTIEQCAEIINNLKCQSVHIDVCQGIKLPAFFSYEIITLRKLELFNSPATVHIFWFTDIQSIKLNGLRKTDRAMLHILPNINVSQIDYFVKTALNLGCEPALALDTDLDTNVVKPFIQELKAIYVMGTPLGTHEHPLENSTINKLKHIRETINLYGHNCKLGIDGGINEKTFLNLTELTDEIVIGSLLFNSPNIYSQWNTLTQWINE